MSDSESALARSWVDEARQVTLSNAPDATTVAIENMLVLGIPHPVDVRDIHAALEGVRAEYRKKVERCGKAGLFYSWVDDASGTIRCGFGEVTQLGDLPFRCSLKRANTLAQIAGAAIAAQSGGIIPWGDLVEVDRSEWSDSEADDDVECIELLVFAESLGPAK